jgi:hypothetical protein
MTAESTQFCFVQCVLFLLQIRSKKELEDVDMEKRLRTAFELEEEMRVRLGPGDYRLTVHRSPVLGWHAMVDGNRQSDVDRLQAQADTVAAELAQHYQLADD